MAVIREQAERPGTVPEGILPLVQTVAALLERRLDRHLRIQHGLTLARFEVLQAVATSEAGRLRELAAAAACSQGNLTGILDRLERDGWLERVRSNDDRRVVTIELTEKGHTISLITEDTHRFTAQLLAILPADELQLMAFTLRRLSTGTPAPAA